MTASPRMPVVGVEVPIELSWVSTPVFGTLIGSSSGMRLFRIGMMLSGMWPMTRFSAF